MNDVVELVAMTRAFATDIVTWRYPPPYDCYDQPGVDVAALVDPDNAFFAVVAEGRLIGFRSFSADGQVPGGSYDASALDTGGGLRPELTGKGLGAAAISAGLTFGQATTTGVAYEILVVRCSATS